MSRCSLYVPLLRDLSFSNALTLVAQRSCRAVNVGFTLHNHGFWPRIFTSILVFATIWFVMWLFWFFVSHLFYLRVLVKLVTQKACGPDCSLTYQWSLSYYMTWSSHFWGQFSLCNCSLTLKLAIPKSCFVYIVALFTIPSGDQVISQCVFI